MLDIGSLQLEKLTAVAHVLTWGNQAVSVSVWRDGAKIYGTATGTGAGGQQVTTDTPLVLASVSKLVTALTVGRLVQAGLLDPDAAVPWDAMGIAHHPWWDDVTVRELLWHWSGMAPAQESWLDLPGSCVDPLSAAMLDPPRVFRGRWVYSNGNYCALGLLIEHVTSQRFDDAARSWLFDGLGITGPHLTVDGLQTGDGPYALDVRRLDRLGAAGNWMASTDDMALLLSSLTDADRAMLAGPGVMTDQYGWGHTGTIDGAKGCAWVMEAERTVLVAVVAGNHPKAGSQLCDAVVPALAEDLGFYAGLPVHVQY